MSVRNLLLIERELVEKIRLQDLSADDPCWSLGGPRRRVSVDHKWRLRDSHTHLLALALETGELADSRRLSNGTF